MSYHSAIAESIDFIEAAGVSDTVCDTQSRQLTSMFGSVLTRKADCTDAMRLLSSPRGTAAFPNGRAAHLIAQIVASSSSSELRMVAGNHAVTVSTKQDHEFFENYLTRKDWDRIESFAAGRTSPLAAMTVLANRAAAIRMFNPKPYVCSKAASIAAASRTDMPESNDIYEWAFLFKRRLVELRNVRNRPAAGPTEYPQDPVEFVTQHPECYSATDPPIASTLDTADLAFAVSQSCCRNTNRRMKTARAPPRHVSGDSLAIADMRGMSDRGRYNDIDHTRFAALQVMLETITRDRHRTDAPSAGRTIDNPHNRRLRSGAVLALENIGTGGDAAAGPAPTHDADATETDADADCIADGIDDIIEKTSGVMHRAAMKRPAAQTKRKSKALKRPAGAAGSSRYTPTVCTSRPLTPDVDERMHPMIYKGCKIMSFQSRKKWRVWPKPGESLYDKAFAWGSDPSASWKSVLAFCERPSMPSPVTRNSKVAKRTRIDK